METIFNALGGRKMTLALLVLAIGTVAFFLGKLTESGWLDLAKWDLVGFLGANLGGDFAEMFKRPPEPPAP
jgi:hypothetical protein